MGWNMTENNSHQRTLTIELDQKTDEYDRKTYWGVNYYT